MPDGQVMRHLAFSFVACGALLLCAGQSAPRPGLHGAVRWASYTTLLGAFVDLLWWAWERRRPPRRQEYSGVELDGGFEQGLEVRAVNPELTLESVWVYVYGAGLMLFVSLYSLSGVSGVSACWWVMGMTPLAMDELLGGGDGRVWVGLLMFMIYINATYLWLLESSTGDALFGCEPLGLLAGIVAPVLSPFLFLSVRARASALRDASRLCRLALPFMVVLALCALTWNEGGGRRWITRGGVPLPARAKHFNPGGRFDAGRGFNATHRYATHPPSNASVETPARFYATDVVGDPPPASGYLPVLFLLLSPFAAGAVLWQLVASVTEGFTAEFIVSLLWALCIRHWALHEGWTASVIGVLSTGLAFLLVLCFRRA
jgi:hypothetical protein